jgi:hypothetical protein
MRKSDSPHKTTEKLDATKPRRCCRRYRGEGGRRESGDENSACESHLRRRIGVSARTSVVVYVTDEPARASKSSRPVVKCSSTSILAKFHQRGRQRHQ